MLASRSLGLVTYPQLRALGFTAKMIRSRADRGLLFEQYPGVFAVGHPPSSAHAHWLAAVLACGPGAVLSHEAAAALWGVRAMGGRRIDVSAPTRRGLSCVAIRHHHVRPPAPIDVAERFGIPVTALPRTFIDLATMVRASALEYAIHRAESQGKIEPADLRAALARLPHHRGVGPVRRILAAAGHDLAARTRSPFERHLLSICREFSIPSPRVNKWIPLEIAAGGLEVDFCWPRLRLIVEVDEDASHSTMRARRNDPERDRALVRAGWSVLRISEEEFGQPEAIAARLLAAIAARTAAPTSERHESLRIE